MRAVLFWCRRVGRFLAAVVLPALPVLAEAAESFSFDGTPGRLPKNVRPLHYSIAIEPNLAARRLDGRASVLLEVREATATLVFNSNHQRLRDVRLDGRPVKRVVSNDTTQLTTVSLRAPVAVGRHTLTFAYTGRIESGPVGLFAQPYVTPGGAKGTLLTSQLEATDARRLLPCWDEPVFRASFELTATVPATWAVVSNMPVAKRVRHGKLATTTFARTPPMPSYLLHFSAGDLAAIGAQSDGTALNVWAVRGQEQGGATALANAQLILADYNAYFGIPYPLPKLDSIAVPGGFSGAMENWGAITYNDQTLLVTPTSTLANRQDVFSTQAHEIAHQWYGNLVTMAWWDELWLNESFATWLAAKETDRRHPNWSWWEGQDADKEGAMSADAREASQAIQRAVRSEVEIDDAFDAQITYAKGSGVLRMLESFLGEEAFRDGIHRYLQARAFSNATSADLWQALAAASGRDVAAVAGDWTTQPGFPLVSARAECDVQGRRSLTLTQQRFLLQGSDGQHLRWNVPLLLRAGSEATPSPVLLDEDLQALPAGRCDEALSLNAGAVGYYRVAYDDATLQINTRQFGRLPPGDRIALLDDQWALAEAGVQPLERYLALAQAMGSDLDARAWNQIADAFVTIEGYERGTPGHDAFAAYARAIVKPLVDRLGWEPGADEAAAIQTLRYRLIGNLGAWGDEAVIAEAQRRFSAYLDDRNSLAPDAQAAVLSIVARHADATRFEQLHRLAKASRNENELRRHYEALVRVRDPQLAAKVVDIVMGPDIPPQAEALRLHLIFELADEHPALAWATFRQQADTLLASRKPYDTVTLATDVPETFWQALPPDALEAWVRPRTPPDLAPKLARSMQTARFKRAEKRALVRAADAYVSTLPASLN